MTNMTFERTLSLATQKLFQPKTFYNIRDRTNAILEFSECPESSYLSKTDIFDFGKYCFCVVQNILISTRTMNGRYSGSVVASFAPNILKIVGSNRGTNKLPLKRSDPSN